MPNYNTVGPQLNTLADGPLAGFYDSINSQTANDFNQRLARDSDLQNLINQIKLQSDQANLGVTQAEDKNKISAAGVLANQFADGSQQQLANTDVAAKIAANQGSALKTKEQVRAMAAPIVVEANEYIKSRGGKLDPMNDMDIAKWKSYSQRMEALGVHDWPQFPDHAGALQVEQWAQKASDYARASSDAIVNSTVQKQKLAQIGAEGDIKKDVATTEANASVKGHELMAGATRYSADQKYAIAELQQERAVQDQGALHTLIFRANKNGWTENDVGTAEYLQQQIVQNRAAAKIAALGAYNNQAQQLQIMKETREQGQAELDAIPGYVNAKRKYGSGTPNSIAPAPTSKGQPTVSGVTQNSNVKDDLPKIKAGLEASGQKYEPDKYMYMVTPDGKILRKPH